jgi:glycosyltransferase involved in cell wall biosynthesis
VQDLALAPDLPFVSAVVPVRNDVRIRACIEGLLAQTWPQDRYEIIIVDNGSTDGTRGIVAEYPVTLLVDSSTKSSYVSRNTGVRHARGSVIALLDSDCRPSPHWIEEGVRALTEHQADLAGGHVRFVYSSRPSGAELYDSVTNMQQGRDIARHQVAKTANLFVRSCVFASIGIFPAVRSGGDVLWTRLATSKGHRLVFAPAAEVQHPTRGLASSLLKAFRVGKGRYDRHVLECERHRQEGGRVTTSPGHDWKDFKPPHWRNLRLALNERQLEVTRVRLLRTWSAGWLYRIVMALGSAWRAAF